METNEELGLKVATNPTEAMWERAKKLAEREVTAAKEAIVFNEAVVKLCETKLEEKDW